MKAKKPFNDFCLVELSHLSGKQIAQIIAERRMAEVRNELGKRLWFAQKMIETKTKPGDLILVETPLKYTLTTMQKAYPSFPVAQYWEPILKDAFNFYYEIAERARHLGRRVESLDSGLFTPGSRLARMVAALPGLPKESQNRINLLTTVGRNKGMKHRILTKKPRMVITAAAHAVAIEHALKPRTMAFYTEEFARPERKTKLLAAVRRAAARLARIRRERKKRRQAIRSPKQKPM